MNPAITLNAGVNDTQNVNSTSTTSVAGASGPSIALVEPFRIFNNQNEEKIDCKDCEKLSPPLLGPIVRIRGRNVASPCSLPGTPIQLPPPDCSMKRLSDPFTNSNTHIHQKSHAIHDINLSSKLHRNNSDFFSSNLSSASVPCFRRYQMNHNSEEWEKKRLKMLEYQSMLDEQRREREQRKKLQLERQKREEELWDKKLQEQQERIRYEFEEEKRKQREREENIERKRQIVIDAIESKSRELSLLKKPPAQADTISLMSVDAVLTKNVNCINDSPYFGDPIKRTQSMYEVQFDSTDNDNNSTTSTSKSKEYSDVNVQTDYSLLLTWLFDVKNKKDWEEFFNRQSNSPSLTDTATDTNDSSVSGTIDQQREKTLTTSHTLNVLPKTPVKNRTRASPSNATWTKGSTSSCITGSSSSSNRSIQPFIGSPCTPGKSRWHAKKNDSIESKSVTDLRKRHIEHAKDFKVRGVTAIKDTKNSLADGGE